MPVQRLYGCNYDTVLVDSGRVEDSDDNTL
jgi:hypothetical protein